MSRFLRTSKTIFSSKRKYLPHLQTNNFRDVQNLYPDKASMDVTLNELTSTCWDKKYQPLTIDMTKDIYTGRYRLGLNSLFVPGTFPFSVN